VFEVKRFLRGLRAVDNLLKSMVMTDKRLPLDKAVDCPVSKAAKEAVAVGQGGGLPSQQSG
jgi:hypothetical protein